MNLPQGHGVGWADAYLIIAGLFFVLMYALTEDEVTEAIKVQYDGEPVPYWMAWFIWLIVITVFSLGWPGLLIIIVWKTGGRL